MSVVVIGVNHRSGPLSVLERLAVAPDDVGKAVVGLSSRDNLREVAVLSTCNRIEVYAVAERFHGAYADIRDFLCELGSLAADELHPYLYSQHDDAAARHLFEVAAGLDSAVLGESEILGQVRTAWQVGRTKAASAPTLDLLFRQALRVGKRARTETAIGRGTASISHAAVEMVDDRFGTLHGRRVLVVGAGEMGVGVATALAPCRSRIHRRLQPHGGARGGAGRAGRRHGDRPRPPARRPGRAPTSSLPAPRPARAWSRSTTCRLHGPAAGRCSSSTSPCPGPWPARSPSWTTSPCSTSTTCATGPTVAWRCGPARPSGCGRSSPRSSSASSIELTARQAAPLVARLHEQAEHVRPSELDRFAGRLGALDDGQRDVVEALTRTIVAKLLHEPVRAAAPRRRHAAGRAQRRRGQRPVRPRLTRATARADASGSPPGGSPRRAPRPRPSPRRCGRRRRATSSWCSSRRPATVARTCRCTSIGGQGVFVKEVQQAVLDGRADVAVHSAKDLPSTAAPRR